MEWTNFYLAVAASAATLIGLLFISVQFNIDVVANDPGNRWRAIARLTFAVYGTLFFLPMILLIPDLPPVARAEGILVVAGFGIVRLSSASVPVWQGVFQHRGERLWQTAWVLVGPLIAYLSLARLAFEIGEGGTSTSNQQLIALIILGLFAIGLRNSWNLLVEVAYEAKQRNR